MSETEKMYGRLAIQTLLKGNNVVSEQHNVLVKNVSMRLYLQKKGLWKEYCCDEDHSNEMQAIIAEANQIINQLEGTDDEENK